MDSKSLTRNYKKSSIKTTTRRPRRFSCGTTENLFSPWKIRAPLQLCKSCDRTYASCRTVLRNLTPMMMTMSRLLRRSLPNFNPTHILFMIRCGSIHCLSIYYSQLTTIPIRVIIYRHCYSDATIHSCTVIVIPIFIPCSIRSMSDRKANNSKRMCNSYQVL